MTSPSSPQPSPAPASGPRQPTRFEALRRWFTRLRSGFGVPAYELQEVDNLGRHIWHRLSSLTSITTLDDSQLADWVNGQFTYPLRNWLLQASRNTRGHVLLSLVVIGGGFATSGIAVAAGTGHKGSHTSWVVFSIGLVVALAGGVSQLFRPGYRATQRTTLAIESEKKAGLLLTQQKITTRMSKMRLSGSTSESQTSTAGPRRLRHSSLTQKQRQLGAGADVPKQNTSIF